MASSLRRLGLLLGRLPDRRIKLASVARPQGDLAVDGVAEFGGAPLHHLVGVPHGGQALHKKSPLTLPAGPPC
ncbi:MAG: hypothetical protein HYY96_16070 [Candidatus Tectomicrobia bacterium]|nr:hypothetical protein [Candidatus Tectomicrobia bacterium]